jgi:hypothetical protein
VTGVASGTATINYTVSGCAAASFPVTGAVGGALVDWLDPFDEREDARQRNRARRW